MDINRTVLVASVFTTAEWVGIRDLEIAVFLYS